MNRTARSPQKIFSFWLGIVEPSCFSPPRYLQAAWEEAFFLSKVVPFSEAALRFLPNRAADGKRIERMFEAKNASSAAAVGVGGERRGEHRGERRGEDGGVGEDGEDGPRGVGEDGGEMEDEDTEDTEDADTEDADGGGMEDDTGGEMQDEDGAGEEERELEELTTQELEELELERTPRTTGAPDDAVSLLDVGAFPPQQFFGRVLSQGSMLLVYWALVALGLLWFGRRALR